MLNTGSNTLIAPSSSSRGGSNVSSERPLIRVRVKLRVGVRIRVRVRDRVRVRVRVHKLRVRVRVNSLYGRDAGRVESHRSPNLCRRHSCISL